MYVRAWYASTPPRGDGSAAALEVARLRVGTFRSGPFITSARVRFARHPRGVGFTPAMDILPFQQGDELSSRAFTAQRLGAGSSVGP